MGPRLLPALLAALLVSFWLGSSPASGEEITLNGSYTWRGSTGSLKVVLTSVGPNEWRAVYTYEGRRGGGRYTGTMQGDLQDGDVTGTANRKEFRLEGTARNGVIRFKHYRRGELEGSGRLSAED